MQLTVLKLPIVESYQTDRFKRSAKVMKHTQSTSVNFLLFLKCWMMYFVSTVRSEGRLDKVPCEGELFFMNSATRIYQTTKSKATKAILKRFTIIL